MLFYNKFDSFLIFELLLYVLLLKLILNLFFISVFDPKIVKNYFFKI